MVEFAIILPALMLMLLGLIEWGFVLWAQTSFVNATRDGARQAVVMQDWATNAAADASTVTTTVRNRLNGLPSSITNNIQNHITVSLLPSASNIESIRVAIASQPYGPVLGLTLIPVPATLSASAEFRMEGAACAPGNC